MTMPETAAPTYGENEVLAWMRANVEGHLNCGEVNCTSLAEEAAEHFNGYGPEPGCVIDPDFFEWSFVVSQWYEGH